jgi:hypothetical protein
LEGEAAEILRRLEEAVRAREQGSVLLQGRLPLDDRWGGRRSSRRRTEEGG